MALPFLWQDVIRCRVMRRAPGVSHQKLHQMQLLFGPFHARIRRHVPVLVVWNLVF